MKVRELVNILENLPAEDNIFFHTIVLNRWGDYDSIWSDTLDFDQTQGKDLIIVEIKEEE